MNLNMVYLPSFLNFSPLKPSVAHLSHYWIWHSRKKFLKILWNEWYYNVYVQSMSGNYCHSFISRSRCHLLVKCWPVLILLVLSGWNETRTSLLTQLEPKLWLFEWGVYKNCLPIDDRKFYLKRQKFFEKEKKVCQAS